MRGTIVYTTELRVLNLVKVGKLKVIQKSSYTYDDLIECAKGNLFGPGNAQLPAPPMLMFDKIVQISEGTGKYKNGSITAELAMDPKLWFFECHFLGDPVMPGCLGLDALWQLAGFYLSWLGLPGKGRALGCAEVKYSGQVTPDKEKVVYEVNVNKVLQRTASLIVADGTMSCDGEVIYSAKRLKVGLFENI